MFCQNCGTKLKDDANFCPECGEKVETPPKTCAKCGAELEEGTKFCAECGEPVPQAEAPIAKKVRNAVNTAANAAAPIVEKVQTSVATAVYAGRSKRRWKLIVPIALILVAVIVISSVSAVAAAERNKPLNRILLAAQNTLKEDNFTVDVTFTEDDDYRRSYNYAFDYSPDSHFAIGEDGALQMYYTDSCFLTMSDFASKPCAFFEEDNLKNDGWYCGKSQSYHLANALGKFILGDKSYGDDVRIFTRQHETYENQFGNDRADYINEATINEAVKNFQEMLSDKEFMENVCGYQVLEGSSTTSLTVSIGQYSDFWSRFCDCIAPVIPDDDMQAIREDLYDGTYSLEAKLDLQDGKFWRCSFDITRYDSYGDGHTFSGNISFTKVGTTRMSGLSSPSEMDKKAERFRVDPRTNRYINQ